MLIWLLGGVALVGDRTLQMIALLMKIIEGALLVHDGGFDVIRRPGLLLLWRRAVQGDAVMCGMRLDLMASGHQDRGVDAVGLSCLFDLSDGGVHLRLANAVGQGRQLDRAWRARLLGLGRRGRLRCGLRLGLGVRLRLRLGMHLGRLRLLRQGRVGRSHMGNRDLGNMRFGDLRLRRTADGRRGIGNGLVGAHAFSPCLPMGGFSRLSFSNCR